MHGVGFLFATAIWTTVRSYASVWAWVLLLEVLGGSLLVCVVVVETRLDFRVAWFLVVSGGRMLTFVKVVLRVLALLYGGSLL